MMTRTGNIVLACLLLGSMFVHMVHFDHEHPHTHQAHEHQPETIKYEAIHGADRKWWFVLPEVAKWLPHSNVPALRYIHVFPSHITQVRERNIVVMIRDPIRQVLREGIIEGLFYS